MITAYVVWAMNINRESRSQIMKFYLRPDLITLDRTYAHRYARGLGTLTPVQEIQIPVPEGWDEERDKIRK